MTARVPLLIFTVLLLGPLRPAPALASCSAEVAPVRVSVAEADFVFSGRVLHVREKVPFGQIGLWLDLRQSGTSIRFAPATAWKGSFPDRQVTLHNYGSSVDYEFRQGERYLVFARARGPAAGGPGLNASLCGRTKPLAEAAADLRVLGAGTPHPPAPPDRRGGVLVALAAGVALSVAGVAVRRSTARGRRAT